MGFEDDSVSQMVALPLFLFHFSLSFSLSLWGPCLNTYTNCLLNNSSQFSAKHLHTHTHSKPHTWPVRGKINSKVSPKAGRSESELERAVIWSNVQCPGVIKYNF